MIPRSSLRSDLTKQSSIFSALDFCLLECCHIVHRGEGGMRLSEPANDKTNRLVNNCVRCVDSDHCGYEHN